MPTVHIGTLTILPNGTNRNEWRPVHFEGELLAYSNRHTETGSEGERLFQTTDDRLIVVKRVSTIQPQQTTYTLHEVSKADLLPSGRFAEVGKAAGLGEVLNFGALTLEEALRLKDEKDTKMTTVALIQPTELTDYKRIGKAANQAASRYVFDNYRGRKAVNTLRRQDNDLSLFAAFLSGVGLNVGNLSQSSEGWGLVTWGLVTAFREYQLREGYSIGTVNVQLSTVKTYAKLAMKAGVLSSTEYALIRAVEGYSHKEGKRLDESRKAADVPVRNGRKKAEAVSISQAQAQSLKKLAAFTPQGRRDRLLMCILLDHGLRVSEAALLSVTDVNLTERTLTFYSPKTGKTNTHELTKETWQAAQEYISKDALPLGPLFRSSAKDGTLGKAGMSERAIAKRVKYLGKRIGLTGLSPHDCRHYCATKLAKVKSVKELMDVFGWSSASMAVRYVESASVVRLEGTD